MQPEEVEAPQKAPEVVHTVFVEGGIYEKKVGDDIIRGMIVSSVKKPNGIRAGTMVCQGFVSEKVIEGTDTLDAWKRVAVEAVESVGQLGALLLELQARVEKLEGVAPTKKR